MKSHINKINSTELRLFKNAEMKQYVNQNGQLKCTGVAFRIEEGFMSLFRLM